MKSGVLPIGEPGPPPNLPLLGRNGGFVGPVMVPSLTKGARLEGDRPWARVGLISTFHIEVSITSLAQRGGVLWPSYN